MKNCTYERSVILFRLKQMSILNFFYIHCCKRVSIKYNIPLSTPASIGTTYKH